MAAEEPGPVEPGDDAFGLTDEEYQKFGEHLCAHYMSEGKTEDEAVEVVLGHLKDPKWKMEVGHQTKVQQEVADMLNMFFEAVAPGRISEIEALSTNYTGNERELAAYLRSEFGPNEAIDVFDTLGRELETRKTALDKRLQDVDTVGSFLRRFFARYEPWDGSKREDKAVEMTGQYYLREHWPDLTEALREYYPRALEIKEIQNLACPDLAVGSTVGSLHAPTTTDVGAETGSDNNTAGVAGGNPLEVPKKRENKPEKVVEDTVASEDDNLTVPASPRVPTRLEWLSVNAEVARRYLRLRNTRLLYSMAREVFSSVFYRLYLGAGLAVGGLGLLLGVVHHMTYVSVRIFSDYKTGFMETIGLLCIFVVSVFCSAGLLTTVTKTIHQWTYLTDDIFFGDVDYTELWASKQSDPIYSNPPQNPVPPPLANLLPPHYTVTFYALPTSKNFPKEFYCAILVITTLVAPLLYGLIYTAAVGENVYVAVGVFFEWWIASSVAVHMVVWIHAWGLATRAKYREWRLWRLEGGRYEENPYLLSEWGVDRRTVSVNLGLIILTSLPVLLLYWVTASEVVEVSPTWSVVVLVAVGLVLLVREFLRDEKHQRQLPFIIFTLTFIFFILGVVGTAMLSPAALAFFITCMVMTHFLYLSHHARTVYNVKPQDVAVIVSRRMKTMGDDEVPLTLAERAVHKSMESIRKGDRLNRPHTIPEWLPCGKIWYTIFSCYLTQPSQEADVVVDEENRHWTPSWEYYGGRGDSRYADPARKVQLSISPKIMLWVMVLHLIASGITFAASIPMEQPGMGSGTPYTPPETRPAAYPICYQQWYGYGVVDMAVMASLAYMERDLTRLTAAGITYKGVKDEGGLRWERYRGTSCDIFVVTGDLEGAELVRDLDIWGDSLVVSVFSAFAPFTRFFTSAMLQDWVTAAATMKQPLDGADSPTHYLNPLLVDATNREDNSVPLVIVGHSTNGGIAQLAGATLGVATITFSPPGTRYLEDKMKVDGNRLSASVVPLDAFIPTVDRQVGGVQYVECSAGDKVNCHYMHKLLRHLADACGGTGRSEIDVDGLLM